MIDAIAGNNAIISKIDNCIYEYSDDDFKCAAVGGLINILRPNPNNSKKKKLSQLF